MLSSLAPTKLIALGFALLIFLLIVWNLIAFLFRSAHRHYSGFIERRRASNPDAFSANYMAEQERILMLRFDYYRNLSATQKKKFLLRLNRLLKVKTIRAEEGLVLTEEMRTMIAASAVQLTFGLESYWLSHFREIVVYPDIFHNPRLDQFHKGETHLKGRITLSWKHFIEGYENGEDKLNLGLHEMAHALDLSRVFDNSDYHFKVYFEKWQLIAGKEYQSMQEFTSFLRDYGSTNFREFFAVCVEHFFEAPKAFREHLPDIYKHMTMLLRQDPLLPMEEVASNSRHPANTFSTADRSVPPEFFTRPSLWGSAIATFTLLLRTVITFFVLVIAFKNQATLIVVVIIFLVYAFNALLLTRFELHRNHLVFKRPLLHNRNAAFHYENIISVSFLHQSTDSVNIVYLNKGEITTFNALCSVNTEDEEALLKRLAEKDIITRTKYE